MSFLSLVLAQAPFLDPGGASGQTGGVRVSPRTILALLGAGFLIAVAGHVVRVQALVAFGIALIFAATVAVPVLLAIAN